MHVVRGLLGGAAAGAAGVTALNAATYLDMAVRGRPSSSTPQDTVEALAERVHVDVPGEGASRENRLQGLGPLQGIATGVGVGALWGLGRALGVRSPFVVSAVGAGGAAMALADGSMAALGVSDPREWPVSSWAADAVPHLAYGAVVVGVLRAIVR
ncbi:hypothetical protein MO973_03340 [Paenibacillus sp. TRM 82003]|uniref:hypothetical protein n=1 Tax=Kineococcus sp. TRM81007 TaxID=2925831 RepID=UPI001F55EB9A|nr:hypothetical protein [Kineococcus sp. TRM81007]MCI2239467.1 hypothetical protein [Kineococcus sp. TRM81007]MCI3919267.1 hypothetical protein [Paenibacillus sp. TRM 82003]